MSDVTEGDLLAAIRAEYAATIRKDGDVTKADILGEIRAINPQATEEQAAYLFSKYALLEGVETVKIVVNGKTTNALRMKTPAG
jgi:hypothetical protein